MRRIFNPLMMHKMQGWFEGFQDQYPSSGFPPYMSKDVCVKHVNLLLHMSLKHPIIRDLNLNSAWPFRVHLYSLLRKKHTQIAQ
jgi:hypothetical protein